MTFKTSFRNKLAVAGVIATGAFFTPGVIAANTSPGNKDHFEYAMASKEPRSSLLITSMLLAAGVFVTASTTPISSESENREQSKPTESSFVHSAQSVQLVQPVQKPDNPKIKRESTKVSKPLPASSDPLSVVAGGLVVATLFALAAYAKFRLDPRPNPPAYPPLGQKSKGDT